MRNKALYIFAGLSLLVAGCNTNNIPPADGIYTGTITTATGTDQISAIIDTTGAGVIIDLTNPTITSFTITSIDDNGNFTAPTTAFAGSGFNVTAASGTVATSGSISGTLNGNSNNAIGGGDVERSTISGNLITSAGASESFTLTYQPSAYEDNVTPLSTIVTPTNGAAAATLNYSYTPAGASTATSVTLTLSDNLQTATDGTTYYPFTGSEFVGSTLNCSYTGKISTPSTSYNVFDVSISGTCGGTPFANRKGLATYTANSVGPSTLTIEYNDASSFAVASSASLIN